MGPKLKCLTPNHMGLKQQTKSETNKRNNNFRVPNMRYPPQHNNILLICIYSLLEGLQLRGFHAGLSYTPGMFLDSLDHSLLFPPKYFSPIEEILPKISGSTP